MKYIIVKNKKSGQESTITFDDELVHKDVARGVEKSHSVISAGFWYVIQDGIYIDGKSESLKLSSRPEDKQLLVYHLLGMSILEITNIKLLTEIKNGY